jgi:hypothetical protein
MPGPTVRVAIPVKNGADYLGEAIESVLAQEGVELSVHVVDNLSDDESVAVAQRYESDPRLRVDVNERDVKYYGSLNRALAEADTDYFVAFAHDDVMYAGNLAHKVEALEKTGAGFAHSTAAKIDGSGAPDGVLFDHSYDPPLVEAPEFFGRIVPHNSVSCQAVVARTEALLDIGGFDARSLFAGDWLTWMRLSLRHAVATLSEPLMANRVHAAAGTGASMASGYNGRDIPATLEAVFRDEALPDPLAGLRVPVLEEALREVAVQLDRGGVRRVTQGWAGYMAAGRRLALVPGNPVAFEQYQQLIVAAGLVPSSQPLVAATVAPDDPAALGAAVEELGGLLAGLNIAVDPERVDETMELLGPVFGETELDVALIPTADPLQVLTPGRIALLPWGSDLVAVAEDAGVPVYPYAFPDPFAVPPDRELWEAVDPARCIR